MDSPNQSPAWIKARNEVNSDPSSLSAWEELIKQIEILVAKSSALAVKSTVVDTFDELLSRFPLLYGFWKKYASIMFQIDGIDASIGIYNRAVDAFPNSLELWVEYVTTITTNWDLADPKISEKARSLFQRGTKSVGYQFLSHPFWDKYISFENSLKDQNAFERNSRLFRIYSEIIRLPLHQYSRYIKAFSEVKNRFTAEQLAELDEEISSFKDATQISNHYNAIFSRTAKAVADRWKYESKFKPTFFTTEPLKHESLTNFQQYLEFEEANGSFSRVVTLYERILVPAASYEKFWLKYVRYLCRLSDDEDVNMDGEAKPTSYFIKSVYLKAINTFLPLEKTSLRVSYLYFLEKVREIDELNDTFLVFISLYKHDLDFQKDLMVKYVNFLHRNVPNCGGNFQFVLVKYLKQTYPALFDKEQNPHSFITRLAVKMDDRLACVLINKQLLMLWNTSQASVLAHFESLVKNIPILKDDNAFWITYFNYTKTHLLYSSLKKAMNIMRDTSHLSPEFIDSLTELYIEYLESNKLEICKELAIEPVDIENEIFAKRKDMNSSAIFKSSHKSRIGEAYYSNLWKSNGNIGFTIEERPMLCNQIDLETNLMAVTPLPIFKNVEKANVSLESHKIENY